MKAPVRCGIFTAFAAISQTGHGVAQTPQPAPDPVLEARVTSMARIGSASGPSWSPDGKRLAFVSNLSGSFQVWTIDAAGGYPRQVTAFDDPVGSVSWSPSADLLAFDRAPGGGFNQQIYTARSDGSDLRRLTEENKDTNFFGDFTPDGRGIHFASNARDAAGTDGYIYDLVANRSRIVTKPGGRTVISDVSASGKFVLINRLVSRGSNDLLLLNRDTGNEQLLTPHEGPATFYGAISDDERTVYVGTNGERDLLAFGKVTIDSTGRPDGGITVVAARADAELQDFELGRQGRTALLVWNVGGRNELEECDLATGHRSPIRDIPGEIVGGAAFSPDDRFVALSIQGSAQPSDVWILDLRTSSFRQLTWSPHPGIDLASLVRPERKTFKTHDDLELSGWLYTPPRFRAPGPVVLSFHGGPEGQERPTFRGDYQALLSRGLAVFAPNIRGSSGFGKAFVNLDNGRLRKDANKDILAAADFLVKAGIGDPKRLGIMGGSYGGYAVLVGLTEFPGTFAAGADLFGIVNFETFFAKSEPWMAAISKGEYGDPDTQAEMLRDLSPIHRIQAIKAPTLVMHGANDTNVPVVEAEQVVENLKKRNVPVEYVLFPDEGHGWRKTPNRIRSTSTLVRFFERYLNTESR